MIKNKFRKVLSSFLFLAMIATILAWPVSAFANEVNIESEVNIDSIDDKKFAVSDAEFLIKSGFTEKDLEILGTDIHQVVNLIVSGE